MASITGGWMSLIVRSIALVVLVCVLSGCITSETLVKLNADRSGTVEQLVLINVKTIEELPGLMGNMLGDAKFSSTSSSKGASPLEAFDEASLRASAADLGEGVRFVSVEKLERGDMQGAKVIYAFDDVNALRISQEPPMGAVGGPAPTSGAAGNLDLALTRLPGGNTLLTVAFDDAAPKTQKGATTAPKGNEVMPEGVAEMITQMFDGFRVAIDVEVNGPIVRTSSPFVEASRVTVLEMDLGLLLKDTKNLKVFDTIPPGASVAEMMPLLKDIKGIKVNASPLTIEFTGR